MEVEREGRIAAIKPFVLGKGQQRIELPVFEEDRGGFAVHFLCVERGRVHTVTEWIDVPWSNKELSVEWMSFRDKLLPGSTEEWRLRISGPKKEKVAAQLLGVMYDASLDHFLPHDWQMFQWPKGYPQRGWQRNAPFGEADGGIRCYRLRGVPAATAARLSAADVHRIGVGYGGPVIQAMDAGRNSGRIRCEENIMYRAWLQVADEDANDEGAAEGLVHPVGRDEEFKVMEGSTGPSEDGGPQPVRTDFRETAFFFPDLLTDRDGSIVLRFTTPDALTRWKVMGLAHTKDLKLAQFTKEAVTSKPLMVVPNLPRFLRQGDRMNITAKINVLEGEAVNGIAELSLFDPRDNSDVNAAFGVVKRTQAFTAGPGQSANVAWTITVPSGAEVVSVRITAKAGAMGDGEERPLPILTDKVLVTESLAHRGHEGRHEDLPLGEVAEHVNRELRQQHLAAQVAEARVHPEPGVVCRAGLALLDGVPARVRRTGLQPLLRQPLGQRTSWRNAPL